MNVADSCGWLEYFTDGPNAGFFAAPIEALEELLVPAVSLCEVFKRVLQQRGEGAALQAVAVMQQGRVAEADGTLALAAAHLGPRLKLAMADSLMLAASCANDAVLWTEDADFAAVDGVRYIPRR